MQQVVFHRFSNVNVQYKFKLRNYSSGVLLPYKEEIETEVDKLCDLKFYSDELTFLKNIPFLHSSYIEFLRLFRFNRNYIKITEKDGKLDITIEGPWLNTILFETPVLAIVSEVFARHQNVDSRIRRDRLMKKVSFLQEYEKPFQCVDFGTRRRYSLEWQDFLIIWLKQSVPDKFIGTSNVFFAKRYNLKSIGTMAHEYVQAMQALVRILNSQKFAFQCWADEYKGRLGIFISDTLGMDAFIRDYDLYFAKLSDGARHDSGDPYDWCKKLINHYAVLGIDPRTKTAVFSNGLTIEKALALNDTFSDRIKCSFGIGTHLTNDAGFKAPQIVIKMTRCNGSPVAKISDSPGKQMCEDEEYLKYLAKVFNIRKVLK